MLCEDFRSLIASKDVQQATRAERIAAWKHFNSCIACKTLPRKRKELTPEQRAEIDRIADEDACTTDAEV